MAAQTNTRLAKVHGMMTLLGPAKLPGMVVKLADLRLCYMDAIAFGGGI